MPAFSLYFLWLMQHFNWIEGSKFSLYKCIKLTTYINTSFLLIYWSDCSQFVFFYKFWPIYGIRYGHSVIFQSKGKGTIWRLADLEALKAARLKILPSTLTQIFSMADWQSDTMIPATMIRYGNTTFSKVNVNASSTVLYFSFISCVLTTIWVITPLSLIFLRW